MTGNPSPVEGIFREISCTWELEGCMNDAISAATTARLRESMISF
jgi:hypothetical protein